MAENRPPQGTALGRLAVALAGCSAAVHLALANQALDHSPSTAALLLVMAGACLVCAPSLWSGGKVHTWLTMLGVTGAMLYLHWTVCFMCGPTVHEVSNQHESALSHFTSDGLGSVAIWLMAAEILISSAALIRLLSRSTPTVDAPASGFTQPEVVSHDYAAHPPRCPGTAGREEVPQRTQAPVHRRAVGGRGHGRDVLANRLPARESRRRATLHHQLHQDQ